MSTPTRLTVHQANELGGDLLRELAEHIGDADAIATLMRHWLDVLDVPAFGMVAMAAVQITFRDCLVETPIAAVPAGALAFEKENA